MEFDFKSFTFGQGEHASREEGMCIMEAAAHTGRTVYRTVEEAITPARPPAEGGPD